MQFNLSLDQVRMIEWGLNFQEATLFSIIYDAGTWADRDELGQYWNLSKGKILGEAPILGDKKDTIYRYRKALEKKGLVFFKKIEGCDFYCISKKGLAWNRAVTQPKAPPPDNSFDDNPDTESEYFEGRKNIRGSENNPSSVKNSPLTRKNIRGNSDNYPKKTGKISDVSVIPRSEYQHQKINTEVNLTTAVVSKSVGFDNRGSPLPKDWRPDENCLGLVRQSCPGVTAEQLEILIAEFKVYWLERGESRPTWGSRFVQWAPRGFAKCKKNAQIVNDAGQRTTRDIPLIEQLTDRSWALGPGVLGD